MRLYITVGLMAFSLFVAKQSAADQIAAYMGDNDPTLDGFTLQASQNVTTQGVSDNGVPAWQMDHAGDSSQFASSFYFSGLTNTQRAKTDLGWTLSTESRVVSTSPFENSVNIGFDNGTTRYDMLLSSDNNGDTLVQLVSNLQSSKLTSGPEVTVSGTDFRLYEMVYDANDQAVDLFVDGVELISGYQGHGSAINNHGLRFGVANGATGSFGSVTLTAVPEPSGIALLSAIGLGFLTRRKRIA